MKILVLTTSFPRWRGDWAGSFVLDLAKSLSKRNDVTVLTPNFPGGKKNEKIGKIAVKRFDYFFPKGIQKVIYPDGLPNQVKKSILAKIELPFFFLAFIIHAIKETKNSDFLLCNWSLTGMAAENAKHFTGKKFGVILRGIDMKIIEGKGMLSELFINNLKKSNAVFVVTTEFLNPLKKLGVRNVFYAPNGIEKEIFDIPKKKAKKELGFGKEKIILFVGSLIERKGVKYLIEAMQGINAKLIIVGEGEEREILEKLAKKENVNAAFFGRIEKEKIPLWFSACDIFVLPSLYEGRPNALLEALASGKACIATEINGAKELVRNGHNGILVQPKNSKEINQKIKLLLKNKKLRAKFEKNAKDSVRKNILTWDESAKRYERLIGQIIQ
ncbi:MAG: glycosyltransferase [Candidatus Diapherotrites archaeon]|nr:glycosyltransferase [Candidatus Diapherotrites archaeon]